MVISRTLRSFPPRAGQLREPMIAGCARHRDSRVDHRRVRVGLPPAPRLPLSATAGWITIPPHDHEIQAPSGPRSRRKVDPLKGAAGAQRTPVFARLPANAGFALATLITRRVAPVATKAPSRPRETTNRPVTGATQLTRLTWTPRSQPTAPRQRSFLRI